MEFFELAKPANISTSEISKEQIQRCQKCFKAFPTSQQLLQHSLVHSNLRKFSCAFCNKLFKQLSHLQQHQRIHTGERPYSCVIEGCLKSFRQLSSLQQHLKGHSFNHKNSTFKDKFELRKNDMPSFPPKPYDLICQICEKHCANDQSFFKHTHKYHPEFWRVFSGGLPLANFLNPYSTSSTKDNPFLCSICNKRYIQRTGYMKHMSSHVNRQNNINSQINGVECKVCKKVFSKEAYLIRHLEMKTDFGHKVALEEAKRHSCYKNGVNSQLSSFVVLDAHSPSSFVSCGNIGNVSTTSLDDRVHKKGDYHLLKTIGESNYLPTTHYIPPLSPKTSHEKYFSSAIIVGESAFTKNHEREFQNCCQEPFLFSNHFGGPALSYNDVSSYFHYGATSLEYYYQPALNSDTEKFHGNLNATRTPVQVTSSDVMNPYFTRASQHDASATLQHFTRHTSFG